MPLCSPHSVPLQVKTSTSCSGPAHSLRSAVEPCASGPFRSAHEGGHAKHVPQHVLAGSDDQGLEWRVCLIGWRRWHTVDGRRVGGGFSSIDGEIWRGLSLSVDGGGGIQGGQARVYYWGVWLVWFEGREDEGRAMG